MMLRIGPTLAAAALVSLLAACGSGNDDAPVTGSDSSQPPGSAPATDGGGGNPAGPGPSSGGDPAPLAPVAPAPPFVPDAAVGATTLLDDADDPATRVAFDVIARTGEPARGTFLMLHDFGTSSVELRALAARLTLTHQVVLPDLRGHGNSAKPACCFDLDATAGDVLRLLATLGDAPVHLVGTGGGGVIARQVALLAPQRIASLTLIATDSTAGDNARWQALTAAAANFDTAQVDAEGAPAGFLVDWNFNAGAAQAALLEPAQRSVPARVWRGVTQLLSATDDTARLPDIAAPTLLLHGTNDPLFAESSQQRLAGGLIREVGLLLEETGRFPPMQVPDAIAGIVERFAAPRGTLHAISQPVVASRGQIDELTADGIERLLLREVTGRADCDVEVRRIEYQTVGAAGESTNATGSMAVPVGDNPVCNGERPLLLYAHGSSPEINYDVTTSSEVFGGVVLAAFAARGYIVVAPNYTGYQGSWLDYHPYFNADAQADDMIDALRASKSWLGQQARVVPKGLFLSGYSQGGYVAMATHRRLQQDYANEFTVTASFPMSGPYSLDQTVAEVLDGRVQDGASQVLAFTVEGYQRAYRNLFTTPADLFGTPYDQTALGIFPGLIGTGEAVELGLLPRFLLPLQGSPYLMRQSFLNDYLINADNGLRQAFARNTLLDWAPTTPMAMCGGGKDQTVFFDNTYRARDAFLRNGADVPYFDFNDNSTLPRGAFNPLYLRFRSIFLIGNSDAYHVALVPFCTRLARDFFSRYY